MVELTTHYDCLYHLSYAGTRSANLPKLKKLKCMEMEKPNIYNDNIHLVLIL